MQTETGYRLEAVTVRKLEFENDAFAFGDKVIEKWYPTVEQGSKKGILLVVTSSKDGALTGGPGFLKVRAQIQISVSQGAQTGMLSMFSCGVLRFVEEFWLSS